MLSTVIVSGWPRLVHADEGGESQDQVSAGQRDVCTSCAPIGCSVGRCGQETREALISCDCTFTLLNPRFANPQSAWYGASKLDYKNCTYWRTATDLSWFLDSGAVMEPSKTPEMSKCETSLLQ